MRLTNKKTEYKIYIDEFEQKCSISQGIEYFFYIYY